MADLAFLTPYYPYRGGIALHSAYLADALNSLGVKLSVFSYHRQYPAWIYPGKNQKELTPPPVPLLPVDYLYDPMDPMTWKTLYTSVKQSGAKALIIPWWHSFWAPGYTWLTRRLEKDGISVIYLIHNTLPHERHLGDKLLARMALQKASGYIVQAVSQKMILENLLGHQKTIELVPHPLYRPQVEMPERDMARQTLGIPKEDILFLSFGFQRPYKGLSDIITAFERLGDTFHTRLVIIGEGWDKSVHLCPAIHRVDTYLPAKELMDWIAVADWFVAANRQATQSGSLALALGCGMPVIVSEALAFQTTGTITSQVLTFPAGDVSTLTKMLKKACSLATYDRVLPDVRPGWQALAQVVMRLGDL